MCTFVTGIFQNHGQFFKKCHGQTENVTGKKSGKDPEIALKF